MLSNHFSVFKLIVCAFVINCLSCKAQQQSDAVAETLFSKENLIPWSIVGFDVKERTPAQRLDMLERLGYTQYAYGHRPRHIPTMAEEWKLARERGIAIRAVWLYINLSKDAPDSPKYESEVVFKNLKKAGLETQIWVGFEPTYFEDLSAEESFEQAREMIKYLAKRAEDVNCKIALYNHGGWYGRSENQLKIVESLPDYELGVVYNFHHAHDALEDYAVTIKSLLPYLWCVNLNGMRAKGPKILTIGTGDLEKDMITQLLSFGYRGPFGILGHVKGGDPE